MADSGTFGYALDEEESPFNQNDLSYSRDRNLRPGLLIDTDEFWRTSEELYDPDDVFSHDPVDILRPVRVNLDPDYSPQLLNPSWEGQTQQRGDNTYPNFFDPDIENEDLLQSSIALLSNELRSFGTPPAGSPSGKNPYGQYSDHGFRDDAQQKIDAVSNTRNSDVPPREEEPAEGPKPTIPSIANLYVNGASAYASPLDSTIRHEIGASIGELSPILHHSLHSGLTNRHSKGQITLPSIADQLGDLNHLPETAANGESTFSHSPPTRPPPQFPAVLGYASSPKSPSDVFRHESLSPCLADYGSSNADTPSADHSALTPATAASAIDRMSIDGITNPQIGGFICNYPGCSAQPFQTQYLLNSHANVHSSNRPHYCSVKGCPRSEGGKGFKKKNEMIRHGLVHDSPGYVCPFCPDREHKYPRPDNLQRHVRVHHLDKNKDDPLLREVLSQRPEGPSRGRRRRARDSTTLLGDIDADANKNDSIENFGENVQKSIIEPERTCHIKVDEIGHLENNEEPEHDLQIFVGPATDSGYASIIQNTDECDEDKDDVQTVCTDNQELVVPDDVKENLASAFSSELVRNLERFLCNWGHNKLSRDTLQELFKEFSVRLRGRASPGQEKDATTFIRHYRNRISKIIEASIASASGELDKKDEDEEQEENPLKKQDGLSVAEKMSLWNLQYPENTNLEDTNFNSNCDSNDDQDDDFSITNYQDAWRFIINGHEYRWLLGRLKGEILLTDQKKTLSESIRAEILEKVAGKKTRQGYAQNVSKAKFELSWDLPAYLQVQFPNEQQVQISSIITIVGTGINAQALTCAEYMNQVWPATGIEILNAMQEAISAGPANPIQRFTSDKTRIDLHVQESAVLATVKGTEPAIAEIGQQLAWLGAALRPSHSDHQMAYSVPRMTASIGLITTFQFSFHVVEVDSSLQRAELNGSCWRPLFKNPVIVKGYPILARFNDEKGLELPLNMMAGLGEACRVTDFLGGLLIKGFSTIFYPIQKIKGSVLWHCNSYNDGSRISYLTAGDAGTDRASVQDVDTGCLMRSRNFLGWTSSAEIHAGSKSVDYHAIKWAGSNLASAGIVLEKLSIGAGHLITGGASFIKGDKDKPIYLSRDGPYEVQIHSAYNMKVVLYDVKDRRGFLVDGASALLHITRTQLSSSPYSESNHFKIEDFNHAEPSAGILAAKQALMDSRNRNLVIFERVEKSKEFQRSIGAEEENGEEKRVIKPWTYEDLVLQSFYILEKIHDYHTKVVASSENEIRLPGRDKLLGFCFMDIVDGQNDLLPRVATLKSSGRAWVDFTRSIRAIPLLGKGFGEIIKPSKTSNKLCKRWRHAPTGNDYLVVNIKTLEEICLRYGDYDSDPLEIANQIYWYKAHSSFENCESKDSCAAGTCDKVQVLLPKRARSKKHPQPFDYQSGGVIFGKSKRFRWSFPSFGEPTEGGVSDSEPDEDNSLEDSGIGESIPSISEIESSGNVNSSPSGGSPLISDEEDYMMTGGITGNEELTANTLESTLDPRSVVSPTIIANTRKQISTTLPFGRNSTPLAIPDIAVDGLTPLGSNIDLDVISQAKSSQVLAHSDRRTKRALDKVISMTSQMFPRKKLKGAPFSNHPGHKAED